MSGEQGAGSREQGAGSRERGAGSGETWGHGDAGYSVLCTRYSVLVVPVPMKGSSTVSPTKQALAQSAGQAADPSSL